MKWFAEKHSVQKSILRCNRVPVAQDIVDLEYVAKNKEKHEQTLLVGS